MTLAEIEAYAKFIRQVAMIPETKGARKMWEDRIDEICTLAKRGLVTMPRPISEAPKDGRSLLCWHYKHPSEVFSAAWNKGKKDFCDLPDGDRFEFGFESKTTHFIPLSSLDFKP